MSATKRHGDIGTTRAAVSPRAFVADLARADGVTTLKLEVPIDPAASDFDPQVMVGRGIDFHRDVRRQVEALPGVEAAAFAAYAPFDGTGWSTFLMAQGQPVLPRAERYLASGNYITPGYFETLGIPLVRGRLFRRWGHPGHGVCRGDQRSPGASPLARRRSSGRSYQRP